MSKSGKYKPFSQFVEMLDPLCRSDVKGFFAVLFIFKRKAS